MGRLIDVRDRARRQRVIAWAEANLPVRVVSTGPRMHRLAEERIREVNGTLAHVVHDMRDGELYSEPLVAAALRAPVISTRNAGLNALEARPREQWGAAVEAAIGRLAIDEPSENVRARVSGLLAS